MSGPRISLSIFWVAHMTDRDNLPLWRCHKQVQAVRVRSIRAYGDGSAALGHEGGEISVTAEWMRKHQPHLPGYFVRYQDGYESWSPADAFEGGYTALEPMIARNVFTFVTETGKKFEILTDKLWPPEERRYIDAHEVSGFSRDFDWGALQLLRKASK
jgi:hypothetical protein